MHNLTINSQNDSWKFCVRQTGLAIVVICMRQLRMQLWRLLDSQCLLHNRCYSLWIVRVVKSVNNCRLLARFWRQIASCNCFVKEIVVAYKILLGWLYVVWRSPLLVRRNILAGIHFTSTQKHTKQIHTVKCSKEKVRVGSGTSRAICVSRRAIGDAIKFVSEALCSRLNISRSRRCRAD